MMRLAEKVLVVSLLFVILAVPVYANARCDLYFGDIVEKKDSVPVVVAFTTYSLPGTEAFRLAPSEQVTITEIYEDSASTKLWWEVSKSNGQHGWVVSLDSSDCDLQLVSEPPTGSAKLLSMQYVYDDSERISQLILRFSQEIIEHRRIGDDYYFENAEIDAAFTMPIIPSTETFNSVEVNEAGSELVVSVSPRLQVQSSFFDNSLNGMMFVITYFFSSASPPPIGQGVCCTGINCNQITESECQDQGVWREEFSSCTPNPCGSSLPPDIEKACCLSGNNCQLKTQAQCISAGGTPRTELTCTPNLCQVVAGSAPVITEVSERQNGNKYDIYITAADPENDLIRGSLTGLVDITSRPSGTSRRFDMATQSRDGSAIVSGSQILLRNFEFPAGTEAYEIKVTDSANHQSSVFSSAAPAGIPAGQNACVSAGGTCVATPQDCTEPATGGSAGAGSGSLPTVTLTTINGDPAGANVIGNYLVIEGSVSDPDNDLQSLLLSLCGQDFDTQTLDSTGGLYIFDYDTSFFPEGSCDLFVTAFDSRGNYESSRVIQVRMIGSVGTGAVVSRASRFLPLTGMVTIEGTHNQQYDYGTANGCPQENPICCIPRPTTENCRQCVEDGKNWCRPAGSSTVGKCIELRDNCPQQFPGQSTDSVQIVSKCTGEQAGGSGNSCDSICLSRSGTSGASVTIGYCSDSSGSIPYYVRDQMPSGSNRPYMIPTPSGTCPQGQSCWCTDISAELPFDLGTLIAAVNRDPTIQGGNAPTSWADPAKLATRDIPVKGTNEFDCSIINGTVLDASLSVTGNPPMVEQGTQLTINAEVLKQSSSCNGYVYNCRHQQIVGCEIKDNFFSVETKYKECPADFPTLINPGQGADKKTKVGKILSFVAIGLTLAAPWVNPFIARIPGLGHLVGGGQLVETSMVDPLSGIAHTVFAPSAGTLLPRITSQQFATAATALSHSQNTISLPDCFTVCANDEITEVATNSRTVCDGYVARPVGSGSAYTPAHYWCNPRGSEEVCGGYAGKEVSIKVKDSVGATILDQKVNADASGLVDYTFAVPYNEGGYNAIVTVTK